MKHLFFVVLALLTGSAFSEEKPQDIVIGKIHTIHSKILNQDREIWIYVPPHGRSIDFETPRFPVVYLLDGDDHFETMLATMKKKCNGYVDAFCPQMILVGITHQDRRHELTPTKAGGLKHPDKIDQNSGGAEEFVTYLEKELIPYIEANYPTAPYRTLIGHSLGGLFAINTFTKHNNLFNAYAAIDPSMWWDNGKLIKQTEEAIEAGSIKNDRLYLAIANTMPNGMSLKRALRDKTFETSVIRSNLLLKAALKHNKSSHAKTTFYPEENHNSVTFQAQNDSLGFLFEFYRIPNDLSYFKQNFDGVTGITFHFDKVSKNLGYKVPPPGELINGLGYHFLEEKHYEKAFSYFDFNLKNYPKSPHAIDSMGNYYLAIGDQRRATELFKQALSLGGHPYIQTKLDKLAVK